MPIEKICDLDSPPIIGKFYLVPCIQVPNWFSDSFDGSYRPGDWVPVLGKLHNDIDLKFPAFHYHYDFRFCKAFVHPSSVVAANYKIYKKAFPNEKTEVQYRRKKCYHRSSRSFRETATKIIQILESIYQDKKT